MQIQGPVVTLLIIIDKGIQSKFLCARQEVEEEEAGLCPGKEALEAGPGDLWLDLGPSAA